MLRICPKPCEQCSLNFLCGGCNPACAYHTCNQICHRCPAICPARADLENRLAEIDYSYQLITPAPAPRYRQTNVIPLEPFIPQLVAAPRAPNLLDKCATVAVGINQLYTSTGLIRSDVEEPLGRTWYIDKYYDDNPPRPLLLGTGYDSYLDRLWTHRKQLFPGAVNQKFALLTTLNYSLYHDHPRLEHLYNLRRAWHTYTEATTALNARVCPVIPFIGWQRELDLTRQLNVCLHYGIHKIAINAQTARTAAAWQHLIQGVTFIHQYTRQYPQPNTPQITILFIGVSSPTKLRTLRELSYYCSFTTANLHILALRHQLIIITPEGKQRRITTSQTPDFILGQSLANYERFLYTVDTQIKNTDPHFALSDRYYPHKHLFTPGT